ncbi:hypothetical protein KYN89_02375 [Alteriqipengyuania sp. NZ-12B]|uniref:Uncharacterized protein n=1 Tax=Alteriqipengyuania abyssalis TaxID=2860200 RepID=A0ABS7PA67_9SPHN|nr:hypothetical protein [Alteriqipengyuania abyssalis]MBY8335886.1 hypothetical protein [Alteriqipengyuania abyssalis]
MSHNNENKPHYGQGTAAGHKGNSPEARQNSREAAQEVTDTLPRRHQQMMDAWTPYGAAGAIPEEVAKDLGLPVHVVRPRAGELAKRGLLHPVGRRLGGMGCNVMAYSVVKPAQATEQVAA